MTVAVAGAAICALGAGPASAASSAAAYCSSQGGTVQYRTPAFGTNNQSQIGLAGKLGFCRFRSRSNGSRIYVSLTTVTSKKPTLAALAYLEKPTIANGSPNANPASLYCSQLGGSDSFGGISAAGGGWMLKSDTASPVLLACVFPDLSTSCAARI